MIQSSISKKLNKYSLHMNKGEITKKKNISLWIYNEGMRLLLESLKTNVSGYQTKNNDKAIRKQWHTHAWTKDGDNTYATKKKVSLFTWT
jgi:hypothetical protein